MIIPGSQILRPRLVNINFKSHINFLDQLTFKVGYVAIVGQPNVGKSTLLNHLLNFKVSAVTRKPQTTRHQIRGILTGENYQVIFFDTPGLLQPKYKLQDAMLKSAQRALQEADLVLFMVAAAPEPDASDLTFLDQTLAINSHVIVVINKVDQISKNAILPLIEFYSTKKNIPTIVPISALKRDGLEDLKTEIIAALPAGVPLYSADQVMDHPERFLVAEVIREKIFQRYGEEIPYATNVVIDEFRENPGAKDFIRAIVIVERKTQKGILIGNKGAALKQVGKEARQEIESLLGREVFLELWVKVREKWRQDEKALKEYGYY
jgi:GTP-binding protein Era